MDKITLYGVPFSLYAGRARSYLVKAGLPHRETLATSQHFHNHVLPKADGLLTLPTIETAEGEVIRDSAAIIDHYEAQSGNGFSPASPRQRILSLLMDVIGAEGLLRPAMHFRWNFPEENLAFLKIAFRTLVKEGPGRDEKAEAIANKMRRAAKAFGVAPETYDVIETLYGEMLEKLERHFATFPYLLGGKPCIGDFGMMAPLFAHLGRDPKPLAMMQANAVHLFRWTERMNRLDDDMCEFPSQDASYLADDEIPDTLIEVLKQMAVDFVPETQAAATTINSWITAQGDLEPGTPIERGVGFARFEVRGVETSALAQPYRFYLLARVQDEFESLAETDQRAVKDLLTQCGMAEVLGFKLNRRIGRKNNLEVWA